MAASRKRSTAAELRAWIERLWSGEPDQDAEAAVPEAAPLDRARALAEAL
ncbi:MAG: hypothetical protein JSR21_21665, partial [Proteobacteria bacterium]|nr:hypothetical protein [Pseudomonadota bacterium]